MSIKDFLGAGKEEETSRNGFLSSRSEWHSIGIGICTGIIAAISGGEDGAWMLIILTGIALGVREVDVGHLKDVQDEPAYALAGCIVAYLLSMLCMMLV